MLITVLINCSSYISGVQGEAVGLRAGERRSRGRRHPRVDSRDGHPWLRRPGIHPHGPPDREERRVQLRRRPPGDPVGAEGRGQEPAQPGAAPGGAHAAVAQGPGQVCPRHGPSAGGQVLGAGGAAGGHGGVPVPQRQPQEPARHVRRRRRPRAAPRRRRRRALRGAAGGGGAASGREGGEEERERPRRAAWQQSSRRQEADSGGATERGVLGVARAANAKLIEYY
jgi:hypothetical protein